MGGLEKRADLARLIADSYERGLNMVNIKERNDMTYSREMIWYAAKAAGTLSSALFVLVCASMVHTLSPWRRT